jgi:hypothetical protein
MDEAAAQAAGGETTRERELERLRRKWGDAYWIGWDEVRGWHARRRDNLGGEITAGSAKGLSVELWIDYTDKPVLRDLPGHVRTGVTGL